MSERTNRVGRDEISTWVRGEHLTLTLHDEDAALVVIASGELDVAAAPVLADALPEPDAAPVVVLDLERLSFLDAGGLRQLLALVEEGRTVTLRRPSRLVRRILEVTETVERFRIDPDQGV